MSALGGHMMSPQEDLNLTAKDVREWFDNWERITFHEKIDGFNVHILKQNGEIRVARGKKDLAIGGIGLGDIESRFQSDRARTNFELAIELATPYMECFREFEGRYTYNCEIVSGRLNVFEYDTALYVHGIKDWETGTETRIIITPLTCEPADVLWKPGGYMHCQHIEFELGDSTLGEYYYNRFTKITGCTDREIFDRLMDRKKLLKHQQQYRHIEENWKEIRYEIVKVVDSIFINLGDDINSTVTNPLARPMRDLSWLDMSSGDVNVRRLNRFEPPIEGVVFTYKGKEYKLTGSFGPLNQLYGKYARSK